MRTDDRARRIVSSIGERYVPRTISAHVPYFLNVNLRVPSAFIFSLVQKAASRTHGASGR